MAKKTDRQEIKKKPGAGQEKAKIYVDEFYFRHVDHLERLRQEYEQYQAVENKLTAISHLTYEEIDYIPLMVRGLFAERVIPDFSYMMDDARVAAEGEFLMPIIIRIILVVILLYSLLIGQNTVVLWVSGAGIFAVLIMLVLMIQQRHSFIERVLLQKQKEIDNKVAYERKKIEEEKKKFEETENERIVIIEGLLKGEINSIFVKIENVLNKVKFSFHLSVEIGLYNNIPLVKVWLPPTSIIPDQICILQSSGRPAFKEKDIRAINKQYLELCASTVMTIMSTIYCHIPTFDIGYVYGMSKEGANSECLIISKLDRQTLRVACSSANGLEAIQKAKASFECSTSLELLPLEVQSLEEWGQVEHKLVGRLYVDLFK